MSPERGFPTGGVFDAAVDAIVVMSIDGLVTDWNPAAERLFGRSRRDVVGAELAELIIPHALREKHRGALERLRETGEGRILNQRLELFAQQADGTLIPIELTVTRIRSDEPPQLFAGFVRDRRGTPRPREPHLSAPLGR